MNKTQIGLFAVTAVALVNILGAEAAPLPKGTKLSIDPGAGAGIFTPCTTGSCFGLELVEPAWINIGPGTDGGFIVGKNQYSGGQEFVSPIGGTQNTTPGELTAAWFFGGYRGTLLTAPDGGDLNVFDDTSCRSPYCGSNSTPEKTALKVLNLAWRGIVMPVGSAAGCTNDYCSPEQKNGVFVYNYQIDLAAGTWSMYYSQVVPSGPFMGTIFYAIFRGKVSNLPPIMVGAVRFDALSNTVTSWKPSVFTLMTEPLSCDLVTPPLHGTAAFVDGGCTSATYTPVAGYTGPDSFTYHATSGSVTSQPAPVDVTVITPPVVLPLTLHLPDALTTLTWIPPVQDADGHALTCSLFDASNFYSIKTLASDCSSGTFTANPDALSLYPYSFDYLVNDTLGASTIGTVRVELGINAQPSAGDTGGGVYADETSTWQPMVSDPNGDPLACRIGTPPANGQATVALDCSAGSYTPKPGFMGEDSFAYIAKDGQLDSNPAKVTLFVLARNNIAPVARELSFTIDSGQMASWQPAVSDAEGQPLTCRIVVSPQNGSATLTNDCSSGTYQSNLGFIGTDSFTYIARDPILDSNAATVTVAVTEPDLSTPCTSQYPLSQFTQTGKDGTLTISFTGNITAHTNKEVKICPGTKLSYQTTSTQGPVVCRLKNNITQGTGSLRINDHLKCTDKPTGRDKIQFKVKSGVK